MAHPTGTRITEVFGYSESYFSGTRFHGGIDLAHVDPSNTPVHAFRAGRVVSVGWIPGWAGLGRVVVIDHGGGIVTRSCHLASATVGAGDWVADGQQVGVEGMTGDTSEVHLHWEVLVDGVRVDPEPYLTSTAGGGFEPFNPEGNNDMQTILERGIDTGFMVTYPTPRGIERVVIDSIANARGVVEQATRSKIVQMYPADFDAFVRVFGPILAPSPGSDAGAALAIDELLAAIDELPTASETADEFYRRLKS